MPRPEGKTYRPVGRHVVSSTRTRPAGATQWGNGARTSCPRCPRYSMGHLGMAASISAMRRKVSLLAVTTLHTHHFSMIPAQPLVRRLELSSFRPRCARTPGTQGFSRRVSELAALHCRRGNYRAPALSALEVASQVSVSASMFLPSPRTYSMGHLGMAALISTIRRMVSKGRREPSRSDNSRRAPPRVEEWRQCGGPFPERSELRLWSARGPAVFPRGRRATS